MRKRATVAILLPTLVVVAVHLASCGGDERISPPSPGRADDPWRHELADTLRKIMNDSLSIAYLLNVDGEIDSVSRVSADIIVQEYLDAVLFSDECKLDPAVFGEGECPNNSPKLLDSISIASGVAFWREHEKTLNIAKSVYRVPPEVVTSILRIETDFGANVGCYKVLNTLVTLYVLSHPDSVPAAPAESLGKRRMAAENMRGWALDQLKFFLLLSKAHNWNLFSLVGSNRAAFGWAQFLPRTFFYYAHDGDGDGKIDFFEAGDAIFNIAHYLSAHGWSKNKLGALQRYNRGKYKYNVMKYAEEVRKQYNLVLRAKKKKRK